ncbi:MAG: ATP-binding protein [Nocardioides sp.]
MVERLSEGEQLWRLTLEHSPVGMTLVGPDGRLLAVNRALCDMLGYPAADLRRLTFQEITHPEDLATDVALVEDTLAGRRTSYRIRKRYLRSDGVVVWGDLSVALLRDPLGRPIHFISQILDVTAQRENELRLQAANDLIDRQRRMAEAVYDSVDVGLVLIDRDGNYESINRRHRDFMALAFPDGHHGVAGQLGAVYAADGVTPLPSEEMPTHRAAQGEEFDDRRIWVGADPSQRRALSVSSRSVRDPCGDLTGAALAYTDVTDFMRALEVKDEFVAAVSHELRTPLTAVLGYLELLVERSDLPTDVIEQVEVAERNAARLRGLVSDLLDVAQASEGGLEVIRAETDIGVLLHEAIEAAAPMAQTSDVALSAQAPDHLVASVDPQRIRQVVDNLLSNGLKYTEPGGNVSATLRRTDDAIELEVADTGIGIAPDDLDRLFGRFVRGREAQERMFPGAGLGLNIVRAIVQAHGGEVRVTSEVGAGSCFTVVLPLLEEAS